MFNFLNFSFLFFCFCFLFCFYDQTATGSQFYVLFLLFSHVSRLSQTFLLIFTNLLIVSMKFSKRPQTNKRKQNKNEEKKKKTNKHNSTTAFIRKTTTKRKTFLFFSNFFFFAFSTDFWFLAFVLAFVYVRKCVWWRERVFIKMCSYAYCYVYYSVVFFFFLPVGRSWLLVTTWRLNGSSRLSRHY